MGQESRCIHCMQGVVLRGVCTSCGKPETEDAQRPINALPVRYLLGQKQYELGRVLGSGGYGINYLSCMGSKRRTPGRCERVVPGACGTARRKWTGRSGNAGAAAVFSACETKVL